ncbi:blue copper protein 1b [Rosa chinensis]|uniref:blue copper protein 1b n=1 Tax=Rosa chinensis TaxID=74649 RepID=UPI001AD91113|nr:blue copper protein 1b [Rosa chinensis]
MNCKTKESLGILTGNCTEVNWKKSLEGKQEETWHKADNGHLIQRSTFLHLANCLRFHQQRQLLGNFITLGVEIAIRKLQDLVVTGNSALAGERSEQAVRFVLAILAIVAPSILATDFIVGDDKGWTINVDYRAWAQGKLFVIGDNHVFNYPEGVHNVLKVNGTGFQECAAPAGTVVLTSGKDVINLATTGRKWYICGVSKHRQVGPQKLFITVMPASFAPRS